MRENQRLQLREDVTKLQMAAAHLQFSVERCQPLLDRKIWSPEELERLESLSSKFARLADLLTQRVMRTVDYIELTPDGSLLDRIHRLEKRGWCVEAAQLVRMRELRNVIAREYAAEKNAGTVRGGGIARTAIARGNTESRGVL